MSIKELSVSNSYNDGGNIHGHADVYANNMYSRSIDTNAIDFVGGICGGVFNSGTIINDTLTSAKLTSTFSMTPRTRYEQLDGAALPTVSGSVFPCGVVTLGAGITQGILLPDHTQLDAALDLGPSTPGPLIWFDVINNNPTDDLVVAFNYNNFGDVYNKGIPKAQKVGVGTYTRFWFVKPGSQWIILNPEFVYP
jgi:hypothetical protein